MGLITVERHIFYLEPKVFVEIGQRGGEQSHLLVRSIRTPWGHGTTRTVGYLHDDQFGGIVGKVGGQSIDSLRDFFLGMGRNTHPKLIVANVTASDLMTKTDAARTIFKKYTATVDKPAAQGRVTALTRGLKEESYKDALAAYMRGGPIRKTKVKKFKTPYKAEFPKQPFNTVWLFQDPTKPGRTTMTPRAMFELGKETIPVPHTQELFQGMQGGRKMYDPKKITILGVVYMLQYWEKNVPADVHWLESVQQTVRPYITKAMQSDSTTPTYRTRGNSPTRVARAAEQTWYVMGSFELPAQSERFKLTPGNRVRKLRTFRPGMGFSTSGYNDQTAIKPMFTVQGRNVTDAKNRAQALITRNMYAGDSVKWEKIEQRWWDTGRQVLNREVAKRLHRTSLSLEDV